MKILEGITVIDLSHWGAMPTCSMILADLGANVIKVEGPYGETGRYVLHGAFNATLNRNKRAISVNLKTPMGKEIMRKLASQADVFLENFAPGAIERMGFGYGEISILNPRIIYASISGFGQTGPYKNLSGLDVVAQAMSGIMMVTGEPDRLPARIGTSLIDLGTGVYCAMAVLSALLHREKTGKGQRLDLALLDVAIFYMSQYVADYSISGDIPQRHGTVLPWLAPYQVFQTSDGLILICVHNDKTWQTFCQLFQLDDLAADPKYGTNDGRVAHREELSSRLAPFFEAQRLADVCKKLFDSGIPHAPVLRIDQVIENEHVKKRNLLCETDHPEYGKIKLVKTPVFYDGEAPDIRSPSPRLGQHTTEILQNLGYSQEDIERLASDGTIVLGDT